MEDKYYLTFHLILALMDNLSQMFNRLDGDKPNTYIFTFAQPTKTRKITYRQQQELLRIALEEDKEFKDGFIMDTIEKGGIYIFYLWWFMSTRVYIHPPHSKL